MAPVLLLLEVFFLWVSLCNRGAPYAPRRASCPGVTTEEPGGGCEQAGGGFQQIPHLSQTGPLNRIQDLLLSSFLYFLFDFLGI